MCATLYQKSYVMDNMKNVGILTWHYYPNFGSALQAFALQHTIEALGYKVSIVNYRNPKFGKVNAKKDLVRLCLANTLGRIPHRRFGRFLYAPLRFSHRYHHAGKPATDESALGALAKKFDTLVCGSDQIWAPNVFNPVYFASFADDTTRRISYAASIGLNAIPQTLAPRYRELLHPFSAVSVREEEGKDLLRRECGIDATVVLDPTLLVDAAVYSKMQRRVPGVGRPYLFCYFLNKRHAYRAAVERYAREKGLRIVGISENEADEAWMTRLTGLGADHFIWLVSHAEAVATDSYHGSIFSLIFHKDLWIFQRFAEDSPVCQNSRIRQLQSDFGIGQRMVVPGSELGGRPPIDYAHFEARLKELRASSIRFLKNSL